MNRASWIAAAIGGCIVFAAAYYSGFMGFLSPTAPKKSAPNVSTKVSDATPTSFDSSPTPRYDATAGDVALAKLWTEVDVEKLVEITNAWKPAELAPILMKMKQAKVSELLSAMKPERASEISREIRRLTANASS